MMWSRWLLLFAGWTVLGAVQGAMGTALMVQSHDALQWLFAFYLPLAWVWAALTPAIGWWTRAVNERFVSAGARMLAHLPLLVAAAMLHTSVRRVLIVALGETAQAPFEASLLYFADITVACYLAAVWSSRVLDASARLVARERQRQQLQGQLVAAQMEYLELQLRPHFLFNALSTIAELAHEAPKSAASMLRNVIALLEAAMARHGRGLVSLDDELRTLRPYLAIQRLRFADWLEIDEDIAEAAKRALVPQFILQPLVENAVHHGLIDRTARGRIGIYAHAKDGRLRIAVVDNGVGLHAPTYQQSRGLGLANLRARLATVYGTDARLQLGDGSLEEGRGTGAGGTAAVVDIPLRTVRVSGEPAAPPEAAPVAPARSHESERRSPALEWASGHPIAAVIIAWSAVAVLRTQHSYAYLWLRHRYTPGVFLESIRFDVIASALWLAMTPLVLKLARVAPLQRGRIPMALAVHMSAAVVLAFTHAVLTRWLSQDFSLALWSGPYSQVYAWNVSVYAILLILVNFRDIDRWIQERDVATERLRKELQEARFQKVMLELRPAVLLDALKHLVNLVASNARKADTILADIGEFLRATLDAVRQRAVPLRVEADGVRAYARVLGVTGTPSLRLQLSIPLALMEEPVPNGILRAALDAAVGESSERTTDVRIDVASDADGMLVCATSSATSDVMAEASADHRLAEYAEQGLIEPLPGGGAGVWFRIGAGAS